MGSSTAVQSAWEKEKNRLESLLLSAEGYGIFRRAQLVEPDTKAGNENFIARSEDALGKLHQADAKQPGQYVVLQNLGIVYGDPRYDIRNQKIAVARRYFERSTEIKPNDYFGLQSLAVLAVRQGYAWGVDYAEEPFKSAVGKASESLKVRPGNGTVFVTQAQLATLFWSADVEANKKKWEASFNTALANAHGVRANPIRVLVARLQWGLLQLRAATADPPPPQNPQPGATTPQPQKGTFSVEKAAFKSLLDEAKTEASKIPGWEAEQLGRVIKSFLDRIDPLPFEKRDTLVWPASPLKPD
jgi:hypothetical protein